MQRQGALVEGQPDGSGSTVLSTQEWPTPDQMATLTGTAQTVYNLAGSSGGGWESAREGEIVRFSFRPQDYPDGLTPHEFTLEPLENPGFQMLAIRRISTLDGHMRQNRLFRFGPLPQASQATDWDEGQLYSDDFFKGEDDERE